MGRVREFILNRISEITSDKKHLISKEQIAVVRRDTRIGGVVDFKRDEEEILGEVKAKYPYTFMLTDGRVFTWVDYIIGSPSIRKYLKANYPVDKFIHDYVCVPAKPDFSHYVKKVKS